MLTVMQRRWRCDGNQEMRFAAGDAGIFETRVVQIGCVVSHAAAQS